MPMTPATGLMATLSALMATVSPVMTEVTLTMVGMATARPVTNPRITGERLLNQVKRFLIPVSSSPTPTWMNPP